MYICNYYVAFTLISCIFSKTRSSAPLTRHTGSPSAFPGGHTRPAGRGPSGSSAPTYQAAEEVGFGTCHGERKANAARGLNDTGCDLSRGCNYCEYRYSHKWYFSETRSNGPGRWRLEPVLPVCKTKPISIAPGSLSATPALIWIGAGSHGRLSGGSSLRFSGWISGGHRGPSVERPSVQLHGQDRGPHISLDFSIVNMILMFCDGPFVGRPFSRYFLF